MLETTNTDRSIPDERDQMASEREPHWPETRLEKALRRLDELERRVAELEARS